MRPTTVRLRLGGRAMMLAAMLAALGPAAMPARGGEPDSKMYWDVKDVRTGMKGVGKTVMVGTKLEEFQVEVLGVMRDVSPGRDMVLCRLSGLNLEHSGIVQGMSGSPVYIDGKLLGAVAFGWEFAKDPIAGITPFSQMVQYVRSNDKRIATEGRDRREGAIGTAMLDEPWNLDRSPSVDRGPTGPMPVSGGGLAGMKPIATPLAATGFTPRALAILSEKLGPLNLAPMAGGGVSDDVLKRVGDLPLGPGSPLSIAMVTGDFDLSGIGTVTHVEGDRVYGFGHPMYSLGPCEFPMMTGYIHTVYPRTSVSMKMGSPLKTVGVLDTDVSTAVAGRVGPSPDMLPMSVKVKVGRYSEAKTFRVRMVREPSLLPMLVMSVLANAIDTEGNLPDELTAKVDVKISLKDRQPIEIHDILSGPRYSGPMGPTALFNPVASLVNMLVRNPMAPVRIEDITCEIDISNGRKHAEVESIRLATDRLEPGQTLKAMVTIKPFKGERETVEMDLPLPADLPEGAYEAAVCDTMNSLRRRFRNEPHVMEPRDLDGILRAVSIQTAPKRTSLYLHVPLPDRGIAVQGQALPNLPGSVRAAFGNGRQTPQPSVRADLMVSKDTGWVVEGTHSVRFTVVKDADVVR
jgi:hypothetical protein